MVRAAGKVPLPLERKMNQPIVEKKFSLGLLFPIEPGGAETLCMGEKVRNLESVPTTKYMWMIKYLTKPIPYLALKLFFR